MRKEGQNPAKKERPWEGFKSSRYGVLGESRQLAEKHPNFQGDWAVLRYLDARDDWTGIDLQAAEIFTIQ